MGKIRVAINGFGRIGRLSYRNMLNIEGIDIVAINDLSDTKTLAHLLKYDSVQGTLPYVVQYDENTITVNGDSFQVLSERDPKNLPWKEMQIDVVLESTGIFNTKEKAGWHIEAGAKRVVLSAPPKGDGIKMYVIGVNDDELSASDIVVSNASCTTNCLSPMCKILNDHFGIENGFLTTVHAYTSTQNLQDGPHKDLRRARAAAQSIIPTTTGAAKAVTKIIPELDGKLDGMAMRVPVASGSITDFTAVLKKETTVEEVNALFLEYSKKEMSGILTYLTDELVSSDIVGSTSSCLYDPFLTYVHGNLVKINGWYDNEYGYSARAAEMVKKVGSLLN